MEDAGHVGPIGGRHRGKAAEGPPGDGLEGGVGVGRAVVVVVVVMAPDPPLRCGGSPFALSTAFKRVYGVSPEEHRARATGP
ncbi:MAG TPA: hypothetical protein VG455_13490 [Acidimicrobiales bacterium]|nr:hypothetical protein [Acidimicrobiales bacterium]